MFRWTTRLGSFLGDARVDGSACMASRTVEDLWSSDVDAEKVQRVADGHGASFCRHARRCRTDLLDLACGVLWHRVRLLQQADVSGAPYIGRRRDSRRGLSLGEVRCRSEYLPQAKTANW